MVWYVCLPPLLGTTFLHYSPLQTPPEGTVHLVIVEVTCKAALAQRLLVTKTAAANVSDATTAEAVAIVAHPPPARSTLDRELNTTDPIYIARSPQLATELIARFKGVQLAAPNASACL